MNKTELVAEIAQRTGWTKSDSERAVSTFVEVVSDTVAGGGKVSLPGFGTFERRDRSARTARNPATGASVKVPKTRIPAFRPGKTFKDYTAMSKKDQAAHRRSR